MSNLEKAGRLKEAEEDDDEPDDWLFLPKLPGAVPHLLTLTLRDKRIFSTGCSGAQGAIQHLLSGSKSVINPQ